MCVGGGGGEREKTSGLSQSVRVCYCFVFSTCFVLWALCSKGEMAQKRTHNYYYYGRTAHKKKKKKQF